MKKRLIGLLPYIVVFAIDFYLLPFFIVDTGSAMLMLLIVIPLIVFVGAVVCGVRMGFDILLPVCAAVLFAPTVYLHYNESAWIYIITFTFLALGGNGIGSIFCKKRCSQTNMETENAEAEE